MAPTRAGFYCAGMTTDPERWALPAAPVYFLRHGESTANLDEVVAGVNDVALTDTGRDQAAEAASRLAGIPVARIYASTLRRAHDTAAIVARAIGVEIETVDGIGERDYDDWEGMSVHAIDRTLTPPNGESPEQFEHRILTGLRAVSDWRQPALIVAHAGTFRVLNAHLKIGFGQERIWNSRPVRLDPPKGGADGWTMEVI
jgi:broad specificity phosphatase PhoE